MLDFVSGVYINETNCTVMDQLNIDEVPDERKSSAYWISYRDHRGNEVVSEKRFWITHF